MTGQVIVIGAGIIGMCAASYLQRSGLKVTMLDTVAPGSCSFGNAGTLSTPMEAGLRLAGRTEIAGLEAPSNYRRADKLLEQGREMFSGLVGGEISGRQPARRKMTQSCRTAVAARLARLFTVVGHPPAAHKRSQKT